MNTDLFKRFQRGSLRTALTLTALIMIAARGGAALPPGRSVGITTGKGGLFLQLPGISDANYEIQVKNSLSNTVWQRMGTLQAVDGENLYPIPSSSEPSRFFRVLFPQPALAAAEPALLSASGDSTVYITGEFFYAGDQIRVGGVLLSNVTFLNSTTLSGTLPPQPEGIYAIEVISGYSGAVLATLPDALQISPPFEVTVQEPPEWPPAGPASFSKKGYDYYKVASDAAVAGKKGYDHYQAASDAAAGKKGYDYYKASSDMAVAGAHSNPYFQENSNAGEMISMASPPGGGHVTVLKAHAGAISPGGGHVTVLKAHAGAVSPGGGHVTVLKARAGAISPGGGHVTVLKAHADNDSDDDGYGDLSLRLHSGEIQQQVADLAVAGRGLDFAWVRSYRSRTGVDSPQGTRWSHSYDVRCEQNGAEISLFDGTGRRDTLRLQADGSYTCPGLFREGTFSGNTFRLTFADTGFWEFNPIDAASPLSGRLARIQDRNGNAITCDYDSTGRLIHVVDTLGRTNSVTYTPDNRVASVTDSSGRTVTYAYYTGGENGGSAGDLKSVTSPPVTGTPNRNDFPNGKTTTYTYSSGQPDNRANHLLLTLTDGLGQIAVTCSYDLNPASASFPRCLSLSRASETAASVTYLPQSPAPDNRYAAMRCIVNDPVGNVTESMFDLRNRCVAFHQYTGRAQPGVPVTATANRPEGKLRSTDPDRYETLLSWNNDSLCTRLTLPGGSSCRSTYAGDRNTATRARKRPDLLTQEWDAKATGGADTDGDGSPDLFKITSHYTHDPRFSADPSRRIWNGAYKGRFSDNRDNDCDGIDNDCDGRDDDCDGFVTSVTDPRGTLTTALYDDRGNRTRVTAEIENGPVVDFVYNAYGQCTAITNAIDAGGLRRVDTIQWSTHPVVVARDAGNNAITTTLHRDDRGNVIRWIDPNGNDTLYTYNALDQLVACSSPPYGSQGGARATTTYAYDANNNLVQIDTDNRRETGATVDANPLWTTRLEYDALDRCVAVARELSATVAITNRYEYDANGELIAALTSLAVAGQEPQNRVAYLYDERGLLFRAIAAPGSPLAATNEWAYTPDARPATRWYADGSFDQFSYDGFSRSTSATDAQGNNVHWFFNAAGDLSLCRVSGTSHTLEGVPANRRLRQSSWSYDGLGRCTGRIDSFFDVFTELPIDDGERTTRIAYAPNGQCAFTVNDLGQTNSFAYDSAGRLAATTGPRGDTRVYTRDANGNVVQLIDSSLSDLGGNPQQFTCDYSYDGLDRCISAVDNVGNTSRWFYDSRDLVVRTTDPRGNEIRYLYDGLCRSTGSISYVGPCDADADGVDRGITINTSHVEYDTNSRVIAVTDVNTNTTHYAYDIRDRLVLETCPDGTTRHLVWSPRSNLVQEEDACGTLIDYSYDSLSRLIRKDITPGEDVASSTTFESFVYDGLGRCVAASNDLSETFIVYDSLGNQQRVIQDGRQILSSHNSLGDRTALTYPSGITVSYTYDPLRQIRTVNLATGGQPPNTLATCDYDGPGRLARVTRIDGTTSEFLWNGVLAPSNPAGDYGWQSIAAISHGGGGTGGTLIDERLYSYDRSQNKILRAQTEPFDPAGTTLTNKWDYDALNRTRLAVTSTGTGEQRLTYVLDGKGNRSVVTNDTAPEVYLRDAALPVPADFQVDQYTATPEGQNSYDHAGRLIARLSAAGIFIYSYDYAGRLAAISTPGPVGTPEPFVSFGYDAFGRRIRKSISILGMDPQTTQYLYDGVDNDCDGKTDDDDIMEDYADGKLATVLIYGHGGGSGKASMFAPPLAILTAGNGGVPLFTRCDDLGNVLALTDPAGAVLERYDYGDFGEPQFRAPDGSLLTDAFGTPVTASPAGNAYLFHGMIWESESGLYLDQRQGRYFDPRSGQYTSRSAGGVGDESHSRAFSDNNPWSGTTAAMSRGTVKFFNEAKGFGRGDGGSGTRAQDHNSSRSNKSNIVAPNGGGGDLLWCKRPERVKNRKAIVNLSLGGAWRTGRNPQTGKEIEIAAKNVVRFKAGSELSGKVN